MRFPGFLQPSLAPTKQSVEPAPTNKTCVLLVDDEPAIRMLFAASLRRDGYHVVEAGDGREAIDAAKQAERIDLVITDIRMPKMDGVAMANALRVYLDALHAKMKEPFELCIATGYFNPGGFGLVSDRIGKLPKVRLLLGAEPTPPPALPLRRGIA